MSTFETEDAKREASQLKTPVVEARALAEKLGLAPTPVNYWIVDHDEMNQLIAYDGFQDRYPHWRWGMKYDRQRKQDQYLGGKAFEIVNNDSPAHAFLQQANQLADQKAVITHVEAHADFFANNEWFDLFPDGDGGASAMLSRHARRIESIMEDPEIDRDAVERWIDNVISLADTIDQHQAFTRDTAGTEQFEPTDVDADVADQLEQLDIDAEVREAIFDEEWLAEQDAEPGIDTPTPASDVLAFLREHGKQYDEESDRAVEFEDWQREILEILRTEAYYFAPQRMTKVMNEGWACVTPDTRVFTSDGLVAMREVVANHTPVSDGDTAREVYDSHIIADHETVTIETERGFELTGSNNHRVRRPDGSWVRLDALSPGETIEVSGGNGVWPDEYASIEWPDPTAAELVTDGGAVSTAFADDPAVATPSGAARFPTVVTEQVGQMLGHVLGAGHIPSSGQLVALTGYSREHAQTVAELTRTVLGLEPVIRADDTGWSVRVQSSSLRQYLSDTIGASSEQRTVPESIRRSPRSVVTAFLRGLFTAAGDVCDQSVCLWTESETVHKTVQLLLLNLGISSDRRQTDDRPLLRLTGGSAAAFADEIGFDGQAKARALDRIVSDVPPVTDHEWTDEIVDITTGTADVYDISVADTHRYAAAGLINHNSKWESTMMAGENFADPDEFVTYADHMAKVLGAPGLNPYKLGLEIWEYVENRANRREVIEHLLRVTGITWRNLPDAVDFDAVLDHLEPPAALRNVSLETIDELPDDYIDSDAVDAARSGDIDVETYPWKLLTYKGLAHRHYSLVKPEHRNFLKDCQEDELERIGRYLFDVDRYDSVAEAIDAVSITAGWDRLFDVRTSHNDVTFLDAFLTDEFIEANEYFTYEHSRAADESRVASTDPADVKRKLLVQFTNFGKPTIVVEDGNYNNRNELLLAHRYNGVMLDIDQAKRVLERAFDLWGRPVNLKTIVKEISDHDLEVARRRNREPDPDEQGLLIRYDGDHFTDEALDWSQVEHLAADDIDYDTRPDDWL